MPLKKFFAVLAAACLVFGMSGCQQNDVSTGQTDTEQTVSETQQTAETTAKQTEQTTEKATTSETETEAETSAESEDNTEKTVTVAGQEFSVYDTEVTVLLSDASVAVTDISELGKLKNLKSIYIGYTDSGSADQKIDGLKALEGSETIEKIDMVMDLANEEDIRVLETMPNLKSLSLYSDYKDLEFNIPSLKNLYLYGRYDLSNIGNLTELENLTLIYNEGDSLSPIAKLKKLKVLKIENCSFEDYWGILELEALEKLWLDSYNVPNDMNSKVREKFPNCEVYIASTTIEFVGW